MTKKILVASGVLALLILLPVAIGDFAGVSAARASGVPVPEPGTLTLLSAGLLGLAWRRRARRTR